MNLREPKKKPRIRLQSTQPFPIKLDENQEWVIYTAQLTDFGSCVIDPEEMTAIHSMGFFGKGSLSRSYPRFGKSKYKSIAHIRQRQLDRRQQWLKEVKNLSEQSLDETENNINWENFEFQEIYNKNKNEDDTMASLQNQIEEKQNSNVNNKTEDLASVDQNNVSINSKESNEIIIEDDDICIISNNEPKKLESVDNDIRKQDTLNTMETDTYNTVNDTEKHAYADNYEFREKLLVLPNSDSEVEDYLKDIKPKIKRSFPIKETLHLTFEESFFLLFGLGCLQIMDFDGSLLSVTDAWMYFCKEDKNFVEKYVVYHYFRSKGWVVKPGLKYGGDFC